MSSVPLLDVTATLRAAAAALPTGVRLSAAGSAAVPLSEAMNAVELGDGRLDPSATPPPPPVAACIADGVLPCADLSPQQARAAADKLLQLEVRAIFAAARVQARARARSHVNAHTRAHTLSLSSPALPSCLLLRRR
jgi:hypothetical protein